MESKTYLTFNDELQIMSQYISTEAVATRLDISDAKKTQLATYQTEFAAEMLLYRNPATKTGVVIEQLGEDYKKILHWVAGFRKGIKHSMGEALTEQDYASLFIHKDKARHKHTVPETVPSLELEHIEHLNARISAHHHTTHDKGTRPSLPEGVDMLDWGWLVNDERQISPSTVYNNRISTRSATLKLEFTSEQTSQFCHIVARYGIANGHTGASSEVLTFAIT